MRVFYVLVSCDDTTFLGCICLILFSFIRFSLSITVVVVPVSISGRLVKDFAIFDVVVHFFFCVFS